MKLLPDGLEEHATFSFFTLQGNVLLNDDQLWLKSNNSWLHLLVQYKGCKRREWFASMNSSMNAAILQCARIQSREERHKKPSLWAGALVHVVRLPLGSQLFYFPSSFLWTLLGGRKQWLKCIEAPATHTGDQDGILDSWPQPCQALATVAILGINQQIEDSFHLSPTPTIQLSFKQTSKKTVATDCRN